MLSFNDRSQWFDYMLQRTMNAKLGVWAALSRPVKDRIAHRIFHYMLAGA
jgi:hypothetical protein